MTSILIIEDHINLSESLKNYLESNGYKTQIASTLESARQEFSKDFDLIVLDWMLPDGEGLDFLNEIRKKGSQTPVIFLTARTDLVDKVLGLEMGAHDYLTKPFEPRELLARLRVQLRGFKNETLSEEPKTLRVGSVSVDRLRHKVCFQNQPVELVKKEYDLLVLFLESPEKVFSRDEILNKVWGYEHFPTTRTVDTHVMFLRQKIHNDLIETVRSIGYRLKPL